MVTGYVSKSKKSSRQKMLLHHTLWLLGAGFVLVLFISLVQPFYNLNLKLTDQLFVPDTPSPNIVIIGMDDATFDTYGVRSDWSRSLHIRAIENLSKAGATVIGFDVLFSDDSSDDIALAEAMRNAGNVILPLVGTEYQPSADPRITYAHILSPASPLEEASEEAGHANISPDTDGTVRRLPLVIRDSSGQTYPAFSLAVLHSLFSTPLPDEYPRQDGVLRLLSRNIPVDSRYFFQIDFGPDDTIRPYISYGDVISGEFDPLMVENKIVLIGIAATGELDKWTIPTATEKIPGVYIHAATIDNILNQRFLIEVNTGTNLMILLLLTGITGVWLPRLGLRWGGILVGILFAGYLAVSFLAFENGQILNILYPLSILPLSYGGNIIIQNTFTVIENSRLNQEVTDGYKSTIKALAASIDAKDHYTRGHSQRVTEFALLAANSLSMSQEELDVLEYAGILHDIGKIGIPDSILKKPDKLTTEEWEIIRQHPSIGAEIMEDIPFLEESRKLALHHHERYDGNGYPDGLSGTNIPLGARLLAVADAFDAMTTDRAYRPAMDVEVAKTELRNCTGAQLCPVSVDAFISGFESGYIWRG